MKHNKYAGNIYESDIKTAGCFIVCFTNFCWSDSEDGCAVQWCITEK